MEYVPHGRSHLGGRRHPDLVRYIEVVTAFLERIVDESTLQRPAEIPSLSDCY